MNTATVMAGVPATNLTLYHRVRFNVGDPAAWVQLEDGRTIFMCRDIEMDRARKFARADEITCPPEYAPAGGLSTDRPTETAQALAELLVRHGVSRARCDSTLALVYAEHMRERGIEIEFDPQLGVRDRRAKDAQEVQWLREAQAMTERAMEMACTMIAGASARADGVLMHDGAELTSERVNTAIDIFLLQNDYTNPGSIVAGGTDGYDCHNRGSGVLRTGTPIIVDIFPQCRATRYNGDCTRTVVQGDPPDELVRMHAAVCEAKQAAIDATRAEASGDDLYNACMNVIRRHGWDRGLAGPDAPDNYCSMQHGLGHGVGLEVHEPPLLDAGGPALVVGDCLTIEPGLYHRQIGGVRVEDMVIVTKDGCKNLNTLPEGLDWS
ncbi:MAG: aminopeptidase P family protein [Planctomycetota bacterium]|nr:MAG: aminopeptidase P family protein [Planctomycetota bacterium]